MSKFFQFLKTPTFRKNLIFALLFIGVLFISVYYGLKSYTKHGEAQQVPVLKGMHISKAVQTLKKAGLGFEVDSIYQLDAVPGTVIEQDPDPQSLVKANRTIYLTIITQVAPEVALPDVLDKTLIEATSIINNHQLRVGDTTYISDIARDVVLDMKFAQQTIKPGMMIRKGSRIDLVLGNGRGPNEVHMPNLRGLTLNEAKFALQGVGLFVGNISFAGIGQDTLSAVIIDQSPDTSRHFISIGTPVNLTLSEN